MPLNLRIPRLAVTLVLAASLAACGGGDEGGGGGGGESDRYPETARSNFVDSCDEQPNASRSVCRCALEELEKTMPFEEFKAADEAIRAGDQPKKETAEKLTAAVEGCVE